MVLIAQITDVDMESYHPHFGTAIHNEKLINRLQRRILTLLPLCSLSLGIKTMCIQYMHNILTTLNISMIL